MTRSIRMSVLQLLSLAAWSMSAFGQAADHCSQPSAAIADRVHLAHDDTVSASQAIAAVQSAAPGLVLTPLDSIPGRNILLLSASWPNGWTVEQASAWMESVATLGLPGVVWGEIEYAGRVPEGGTGSIFVDEGPDLSIIPEQYAWQTLGIDPAQQLASGASTVAVLDTGIDPLHPLLVGRLAIGGWDFVARSGDTTDRPDGADSDSDGVANELVGHGTFVASLIASAAPGARILPVRVLDADGGGSLWNLARGLFHAIDRGVEVINVSITSTYSSEAVELALDEAAMHGITVVASAGNCDSDTRMFPAAKSGVLAVAATDHLNHRAVFSSYGDWVSLAAPGASVLDSNGTPANTILGAGRSSTDTPGVVAASGTSFAAPLVAAAAAMVRAQHPEWPADDTTAEAISDLLLDTAQSLVPSDPQWAPWLGAGLLDVSAAVASGPAQPRVGDLDGDGVVGASDLAAVLGAWGLVHTSADIDGDGIVSASDLAAVLGNWG